MFLDSARSLRLVEVSFSRSARSAFSFCQLGAEFSMHFAPACPCRFGIGCYFCLVRFLRFHHGNSSLLISYIFLIYCYFFLQKSIFCTFLGTVFSYYFSNTFFLKRYFFILKSASFFLESNASFRCLSANIWALLASHFFAGKQYMFQQKCYKCYDRYYDRNPTGYPQPLFLQFFFMLYFPGPVAAYCVRGRKITLS